MVAYATTADLRARLGEVLYARLTDRDAATTGDDAVGAQLLNEAESVANSHLAARYATPIDLGAHPELADVLKARVLDLAEHAAWRGSPFVSSVPRRVQDLGAAAVRWFECVSCGAVDLPALSPPAGRTARADTAMHSGRERAFTGPQLDGL